MPTFTFNADARFKLATKPSQCETGCQFSSVEAVFTAPNAYGLALVAVAENGTTLAALPKAAAILTTTLTIKNINAGLDWKLVTKPKSFNGTPTTLDLDPALSTLNTAKNAGTVKFAAITDPSIGFDYGLLANLLEGQVPKNMPMIDGAIDVDVELTVKLGTATFTFPINNIEMRNVIQPSGVGSPLKAIEFTASHQYQDGIAVTARMPFGATCLTGALTLQSPPGGKKMFALLAFDAFVACDGRVQGVLNPNKAQWNNFATSAHVIGTWTGSTLDIRLNNGIVGNGGPNGLAISTFESGLLGSFTFTAS